MAQGGLQEQSIEELEVGYWNVGWNKKDEKTDKEIWHGIKGQLNDVIEAMESNNCDIVFCTDTRTVEEDLDAAGIFYPRHQYPTDLENPLDYIYHNKKYKLAWIEEKEPRKRKYPGGICVIWKAEKIEDEQIKLDVIPVNSINTAMPGNDLEITKHRILTVRISTVLGNVVFFCCYGIPHSRDQKESYDEDAKIFFEELKSVTKEARNDNKLIVVLGDLNAQIHEDKVKELAENAGWGDENKTNAYHADKATDNVRGDQFLQFCKDEKLTVASVLFPNKITTFQTNITMETEQDDENTPEKLDQEGTGPKSDIDHFTIGWADPDELVITLENDGDERIRTVAPDGKGICTNIRVTKRLPNAGENFHRLCIASMNFKPIPVDIDGLTQQMGQVTV